MKMAEGAGFEPAKRLRSHDFESRAFNHSATPPESQEPVKGKKVVTSALSGKIFCFQCLDWSLFILERGAMRD